MLSAIQASMCFGSLLASAYFQYSEIQEAYLQVQESSHHSVAYSVSRLVCPEDPSVLRVGFWLRLLECSPSHRLFLGSFQIFPDPSDFDRYCKLKDRLPSIVVEPTEGDVESGELRWPPEEFLVQEEEEEEEEENCEDAKKDNKEQ